ncbi:SOS response-associated peptidase [Sutcliffiella rhizosphaerae]|uniref:Abasic site processing protein n=1 Tax=Sutcliffiella rhizosphaerae TaxID=2880967 RepID=A0ABN8AE45_9BACI|nr:SOS response-associated peptidase [Sutcliffiella rhizosphaerae]CAG9622002.1 SOS response-associated protein YedK [Sutcliffiella rhizosphaerae]
MCGRFSLTTELHKLEERFFLENAHSMDYQISFNVAPGQHVLGIVEGNQRNRAGYLQWGLVPSFAKDKKIGYKMINARAETLHEKVSFRRLLERRRCLIPADGFYEWKKINGEKIPVRFTLTNGEPFAFAGLWDRWQSGEDELISCTIITTTPNSLVEGVHNRMPVIVHQQHEQRWLSKQLIDNNELTEMLYPFQASKMIAYEVSDIVNSPKNNHPLCLEPKSNV